MFTGSHWRRKAVARVKIPTSSRRRRLSLRSRAISSRSAVVRPSRRPSSTAAWAIQLRTDVSVRSSSRATCPTDPSPSRQRWPYSHDKRKRRHRKHDHLDLASLGDTSIRHSATRAHTLNHPPADAAIAFPMISPADDGPVATMHLILGPTRAACSANRRRRRRVPDGAERRTSRRSGGKFLVKPGASRLSTCSNRTCTGRTGTSTCP